LKPLTLRATLGLLGLGALTYVAVIAAVIAMRIGPTARSLRMQSERVLGEYDAIHGRAAAFRAIIEDVHPMLIAAARGQAAAAPQRLEPWLAVIRTRIDSLSGAGTPALASLPAEMRMGFAAASVEESHLGIALLEALANLELGRGREAARRLQVADSIARLIDGHMADAQRSGLVDLIGRERALADAASESVLMVGVWLGLGTLLAPLVVVFLHRRFYDPLAEIDAGITRVAAGDLSGTIPVRRPDELGRLSAHFNATAAVLRQRAEDAQERAAAALRESEERYHAMVEFAPIGIAVVDPAGRYLHANPALLKFLGYTDAELRRKNFRDVTAPEDIPDNQLKFRELVSGAVDRYQMEKRYVRKDGGYVWGRLSVSAVRDASGVMVHTVAMIEDVNEEKQREAIARESEGRLRHEQAALVELARHPAFYTGDVPAVWRVITETAARTLGVARVGLWLHDRARGTLRCVNLHQSAGNRHSEGLELAAADFPAYFAALEDNRVITAPDAVRDPRTGELGPSYLVPLGITSLIDAPIRVGGRSVGVVCHEHVGPPREWSPAAQSFAGSIADLVALALEAGDRVRAETALRQSEEKFAKAFRSSPNPILITRLHDGLLVDANDAFFTTTGWTREEAIGSSTRDLLWPDPERREAMVKTLRTEGRVSGVELRMRTKAGPVLDVLVSIETIDLNGVAHTIGEALDITARKRAEQQLRLLAQAVKSTSEGISITDIDGRFTFANRAFLEGYGYTEAEVIGQPVSMIDSPRNPPGLQAAIRKATQQGGWNGTLYNSRKDGSEFLLSLTTAEVKDQDGRVIALMGVSRDITEERRGEERQEQLRRALLKAAADWTLTFDAVQYPILILDADGQIRRVNQAARLLAGAASYSDVTDRPLDRIGTGEPWRAMADVAARARRTGSPMASQAAETAPRRAWYVTATPVTVTGEEQRVIVIARDVTDLVQLQESLRRTETMSALGAVVAGVAHEVRNPLFAISATVDAFEARFGQEERHTRYTKTLQQEVSRLSELMHELLEYGKPPRLELAEGPVEPVIRRAIERTATMAAAAGVRVAAEFPAGQVLPDVRLDSSRMLQVFQNLIENAVQHSNRDGIVTVRAGEVRDQDRLWLEVTVADSGPGFREEDLPHVFEPFFTRRRGGTGLGLSIVHRIIEQHGGDILARNRPEGGAALTLRLAASGPLPAGPTPSSLPTTQTEIAGAQAPHPRR
jgi:PAS domain S-box-containing protein